nr:unnamed protein product [Digitaria exilis]
MASSGGAAALNAMAAIAIFAVLVMSSQGHPKKPLCSDCPELCRANCSAQLSAALPAECVSSCDQTPPPQCAVCKSQLLQECQDCCGNATRTGACCTGGCVGDGCGDTCGCDCSSYAGNACMYACKTRSNPEEYCSNCVSNFMANA